MTKRKFKYDHPQNTDERIEAICDELRESPDVDKKKQIDTVKDYVVALLSHLRKVERRREDETRDTEFSLNATLIALAVISTVLLIVGAQSQRDWEWLNDHQFAIKLWGVGLAAVFVGVSIEKSSFFKRLWAFAVTKIISSVAISALIIFCTGKASSLINSVFGVDASAFPYTRALLSGLLVFQYLSPLLIIVVLFLTFHIINVVGYIKSESSANYDSSSFPITSIVFSLLASVVLLFSWYWIIHDFSEDALPEKTYRLAHELDFNSRHACINLKDGVSVVFIGPDQSKVLADVNLVKTKNIESFINRSISNNIEIPKSFLVIACQSGTRSE